MADTDQLTFDAPASEETVVVSATPRRKRLMMAAGAAALLALGAAGFVGVRTFASPASPEAPVEAYVDVPDMLVNMRTADGRPRFLKVKVVLQIADEAAAPRIQKKLPIVIDGFQGFLRELRPEDLTGSSGTFRVKEELLSRAMAAAHPDQVSDVLIQELVQQ